MHSFRNLVLGVMLVAGLVGCTDSITPAPGTRPKKGTKPLEADRATPTPAKDGAPATTTPTTPKVTRKPAKDLKAPEGVEVIDSPMPKSYWSGYEDARVGDMAEYEFPGAKTKSKSEVYDIADHAVITVSESTVTIEGKETKTKSATRMVFDAPEPDVAKDEEKMTVTRRAEKKAFTVNCKTVYSDTVSESSKGGKVLARVWTSKEMPSAVLETQDGEGKASMRLVGYKRGK